MLGYYGMLLPTLRRRRRNPHFDHVVSFFHSQFQSFPSYPTPLALQRLLCNVVASFQDLQRTHSLIISSGHSANTHLAAKLISLYADFNSSNLCAGVLFPAIAHHPTDTFLWNSIVKAHFSNGEYSSALLRYLEMRYNGARPNHFTIPLVASSCAETAELGSGRCVHGYSLKAGLLDQGSAAAGSSLVYMYCKCEDIGDALKLFDEMPDRDVISWTAIIAGCAMNGDSYLALEYLRSMHKSCTRLNYRTVEAGLRACLGFGALPEGRCLQGLAVKLGSWVCDSVKSAMLSLYAKCGDLADARAAFGELPMGDLVAWTEIMGVHAKLLLAGDCLRLFAAMVDAGKEVDGVAVSCLLSSASSLVVGQVLHGFLLRRDLLCGKTEIAALLEMYCRLRRPAEAIAIFDAVAERDENMWALMLSLLAKIELGAVNCLTLFRKMQFTAAGLRACAGCVIPAISSCGQLQELLPGLALHGYCIKNMLDAEISVSNSILGMYGKLHRENCMRKIFKRLSGRRDVITWNIFMTGLSSLGCSRKALEVFDQMLVYGVEPSSATLVIILSACATATDLQRGEVAHQCAKDRGLVGTVVSTALIDMYAKCGQLEAARAVFDNMGNRDVTTWNAMINGYGSHGRAREALEMLEQMVEEGASPNEITFIALLSACCRAGLVKEGRCVFDRMKQFSLLPSRKHLACMVDLLGRSGQLEEAEAMALAAAPGETDGGVWGALLGACQIHGDVEMGERAGKRAIELEPGNDGYYMVLRNLYSSAGRKEEARKTREAMLQCGLRKTAGWSMANLESKY
ncbi:pentatricopeptide repeat-containing protein At4g39952, mitochondrial-like [Wolffia australiana]